MSDRSGRLGAEVLTDMNMAPYRLVLAQPGMRSLMLFGLLSRIPATAAGMVVTLHVVTSLGLGYAQAGAAGAAGMAGVGVGSPLAGNLVDRLGLRPVLVVTTVAQGAYWAVAPSLGYRWLIVSAFVSGVFSIPLFTVMRQFLAAMVPQEQRRTAYALDSMAVEVAYMTGPALAVAGVTSVGSAYTMYAVGAGLAVGGLILLARNPAIRSADEQAGLSEPVSRRQWLNRRMAVLLGVTAATTLILSATELSAVATLRHNGATAWTGAVIGLWCAYSLVGGFVYGAVHRTVSPLLLVGAMAALTVPAGLIGGGWWWLILTLLPAGLLCAPSITATVDTVSSWAPAAARGEAMGLHGTALTVGVAIGAPAAGAVIDGFGSTWGFAMAGGVGLSLVLLAIPFWPRVRTRPAASVREAETPYAVGAYPG
jgi:MFS family permease